MKTGMLLYVWCIYNLLIYILVVNFFMIHLKMQSQQLTSGVITTFFNYRLVLIDAV